MKARAGAASAGFYQVSSGAKWPTISFKGKVSLLFDQKGMCTLEFLLTAAMLDFFVQSNNNNTRSNPDAQHVQPTHVADRSKNRVNNNQEDDEHAKTQGTFRVFGQ